MRKYFLLAVVILSVVFVSGKVEAACRPSGPACDPRKADSCGGGLHCSPNGSGSSTGTCYAASGPIGTATECFCNIGLSGECPIDYECVPLENFADTGQCYISTEAEIYIETQKSILGEAGREQIGDCCGHCPMTDAEGKKTDETKFSSCRSPLFCVYDQGGAKGTCQTEDGPSCALPLSNLNITGTIACVLTNIVSGIIRGFVQLSISILTGAIALNQTIYGNASLAKTGFNIVLQFVNIFFVFGILMIGFATMLKPLFPSPSIFDKINKNILPKFLLAFFLVNFAFALTGMLISFSDSITGSLNQIIADSDAWKYFGTIPVPMQGSPLSVSSFILGNLEGTFQLVFMPLLTALVGVGIILVMSAITIMFFIRWGYLTFLVIISPFIIFMEVFPIITFKKMASFEEWSQQLTRWLLFAPVMMVFIYIVLSLSSIGLDTTTQTAFGQSLGVGVGRLILQLALLAIGLQQADKLSLGGGKIVIGTASRWFEAAKRIPIREGETLGTILGTRVMETPQYQRAKNILAGSFITRPLAVGSDVLAGRLKETQKKSIGEYGATYKDWSKETLIRYLNSANLSLMNPQAQTALLQQLQNKKVSRLATNDLIKAGLSPNLKDSLNQKIIRLVSSARSIKAIGSFEKTRPHEIADYKTPGGEEDGIKKITKAVKDLKPSEILDVIPEAFQEWPVVLALSESHFRKLGDEGTDEQRRNIEDTLRVLRTDPKNASQIASIAKKLKRIPSWVEFSEELTEPSVMPGVNRSNPSPSQPVRTTSSTIITPGGQPNPQAKIVLPQQPNPTVKIVTPGAKPNPEATIITPGGQPNPQAKIVTPGAKPNPEAGIINPYRQQPDIKTNFGKDVLKESARRQFLAPDKTEKGPEEK